jgi:hypothetical protein
MYYHLPSTGLCTTSADWNKYYHLLSTGLCTTTADWNKYYHLPSTGLCTTSNGWKLPLDYILIIVGVQSRTWVQTLECSSAGEPKRCLYALLRPVTEPSCQIFFSKIPFLSPPCVMATPSWLTGQRWNSCKGLEKNVQQGRIWGEPVPKAFGSYYTVVHWWPDLDGFYMVLNYISLPRYVLAFYSSIE